MPSLRAFLALFCLIAGAAQAADAPLERRCGWLENPTPADVTLSDRDGTWFIGTQGGAQAEGDWTPTFADGQWVRSGTANYGYGCACLGMQVDQASHQVLRVANPQAKPLQACRGDRSLRSKPNGEYARIPTTTYQGDGYRFSYPRSWKLRKVDHCVQLDAPGKARNEEYTLNLCARPSTLEQVAEDAIFSRDENGVWMREAGMDEPSPVQVQHGAGWEGLSAVQTCGVSDEETGFHAAGGSCFWAAVSDGHTGLLIDTVGFYQDFQQIGIIVDSLRFGPAPATP
ncbi:MAG: hypothetical protein GAK43_02752 [Stenotrophomonas maltophilia]|nr:MAG: hypothetical protein GAK43_02752 [Stenotrophomonas maltophilia]